MKPQSTINRPVNSEYEQFVEADAKLSNGSVMNLYRLRAGTILFAVSIEGDDYITGPYFYGAGDAILKTLDKQYTRDTVGFVDAKHPANHPASKQFSFNSMVRIREYETNEPVMFYDARNSIRPNCSDTGVVNFKNLMELRLPVSRKQSVDGILGDIVTMQGEYMVFNVECLTFCDPGKTLRINKSYRLDMGSLLTFYVGMLVKNYSPQDIRSQAFIDPSKATAVISSMIQDRQVPSTIGDLPTTLINSINQGDPLEKLIKENSTNAIGQKLVLSGPFFERLWRRDVKSITAYLNQSYFNSKDYLTINPDKLASNAIKAINPYIENYLFAEDFQANLGFKEIAYAANYNKFLDVNTIIYWILLNASNKQVIISTPLYDVKKHMSVMKHRFNDADLSNMKVMNVFDALGELSLHITMTNLGIELRIEILKVQNKDRPELIRTTMFKWLDDYLMTFKGKLSLEPVRHDNMNRIMNNVRVLQFVPNNQVISGISLNWFVLLVLSSFLRLALTRYEFNFISFN